MVIYNPPGVSSLGNETLLWVPAIAVLAAATVVEVTAAGAINVSMAVRGFTPGGDQGTSEDVRLGTRIAFENLGRFKPSIEDITYVYSPQAAALTANNKHYETLIDGAAGYLLDIRGLDAQAWVATAAQKYKVYPVLLGAQRDVGIDPTSEGGKFEIIQKVVITGLPVLGAIAA